MSNTTAANGAEECSGGSARESTTTVTASLGNWRGDPDDVLRYRPDLTMNKGVFSALSYILQTLPHLTERCLEQCTKIRFSYRSHNYGAYPNFEVIGDLIQMRHKPTLHPGDQAKYPELQCLKRLCQRYVGAQDGTVEHDRGALYSFGADFRLAKSYLEASFCLHEEVTDLVATFEIVEGVGENRGC